MWMAERLCSISFSRVKAREDATALPQGVAIGGWQQRHQRFGHYWSWCSRAGGFQGCHGLRGGCRCKEGNGPKKKPPHHNFVAASTEPLAPKEPKVCSTPSLMANYVRQRSFPSFSRKKSRFLSGSIHLSATMSLSMLSHLRSLALDGSWSTTDTCGVLRGHQIHPPSRHDCIHHDP